MILACNHSTTDLEIPFLIQKSDNTVDAVHYDAAGQRELAKRYFEEFVTILAE